VTRPLRRAALLTLLLAAPSSRAAAQAPAPLPAPPAKEVASDTSVRMSQSFSIFGEGDYDPEDLPLAWTREGGLVIAHMERYSSGDLVDLGCARSGFYTVPAIGGAARPLTPSGSACHTAHGGAASPDGTWAIFPTPGPGPVRLVRMDFATARMDTLPTQCEWLQFPAVSPDGRRIAVIGDCDGASALLALRADGSALQRVMPGRLDGAAPTWSPDGLRIAATQRGRIVVAGVNGERRRVLTRGTDPAWSPDGEWIALLRNGAGVDPHEIHVVHPDGSAARRVFRNEVRSTFERGFGEHDEGEVVGSLVWSPDSRWIAFARRFDAGTSVWRVEVATGRVEQLTLPDR
jgi:WD40-like Beta Propeller Repeat